MSENGLVNGAALKAPPEKNKGNRGEEDIGCPGREGGGQHSHASKGFPSVAGAATATGETADMLCVRM